MFLMSIIIYLVYMDIFQNLVVDLDIEGCYFFLNVIVNQFWYLNSYIYYFSCIMLYFFVEVNMEVI